jgi:hypothetical protein
MMGESLDDPDNKEILLMAYFGAKCSGINDLVQLLEHHYPQLEGYK